jgi:hypothetical protein
LSYVKHALQAHRFSVGQSKEVGFIFSKTPNPPVAGASFTRVAQLHHADLAVALQTGFRHVGNPRDGS